jgi:hypothetical protein
VKKLTVPNLWKPIIHLMTSWSEIETVGKNKVYWVREYKENIIGIVKWEKSTKKCNKKWIKFTKFDPNYSGYTMKKFH